LSKRRSKPALHEHREKTDVRESVAGLLHRPAEVIAAEQSEQHMNEREAGRRDERGGEEE
jgi:hypothetical protein